MEIRKLGSQGLEVSTEGLGCMGMTAFYKTGESLEEENINTIGKALESGINFFDTAWVYQNFETKETKEELVGRAIKKFGRDKFIIATKFGIGFSSTGMILSGKSDFVRQQCDESLKRLGIETIDLFYMHRMDPTTPIEETMNTLLELKNEGKIRYVGLSECTPQELERAHKVFPITAIQMEWSLQTRDIETTLVPVARKLGVGIVAYSPLGRGFLSRTFTKKEEIGEGDSRNKNPRFQEENFQKNVEDAEKLENIAKIKGYSAAQLALAWVHSRGKDVFPIPGTKSAKRIEENSKAPNIVLTDEEWSEIEKLVPVAQGERYDENSIKSTYSYRL